MDPFTLDQTPLEEVGRRLGLLYQNVKLSREPMFAWVQIMNDVTILGEDLRRERYCEAVHQAGDVLTRLLEFIGYYRCVHKITIKSDFADFVATTLRTAAYPEDMPEGLEDGPSWWVIHKYPFVCAKCGRAPCHCVLEPWILENRREDPEPYLATFRKAATEARNGLRGQNVAPLTVAGLISHFRGIYRASYYHQDAWRIGMHLSEELGEAMTELGRMEIICRARGEFDLAGELGKAFKITRGKLDDETKKIVNPGNRKQREAQLNSELEALEANLRGGDASLLLTKLIGERFKEEIADILSWLSAIIVKLEKHGDLAGLPGKFTKVIAGGLRVLQCPWCHEEACSDGCLVLHGVSGEIRETVSKF